MAQMAASYCQYRAAQGCCSHTALHLCWASSKEFNLIELDCHHSLRGACVVALGDMIFPAVTLHAEIMPAGTQGRGEGCKAPCCSFIPFLREGGASGCFIHPSRKSLYSFSFLQKDEWCERNTKGVRKPLRSAVSNLCFPVAPGNPAAVWANGQCGVPGWTGHRHLRGDGVQPVVPGIQNQRQEPVRYSQHTL